MYEVFWPNVSGPALVETVGRERMLSTPAHRVEAFPDGSILLVTWPTAADFASDEARVVQARALEDPVGLVQHGVPRIWLNSASSTSSLMNRHLPRRQLARRTLNAAPLAHETWEYRKAMFRVDREAAVLQ